MKRRSPLHPRTAIINQTQKIQSQKIRQQTLEWLAIKFPEAFDNTKRIRPLKIGIMNDILQCHAEAAALGISRSKLREAVVLFTRRLDYLTCLKAQEMRIDLQGNIIDSVSIEDAERATAQIKQHLENKLARDHQNALHSKKTVFRTPTNNPGMINQRSSTSSRDAINAMQPEHQLNNTATRSNPLITHKITRNYDPKTIARFKEKLGLAQRKPKDDESK